MHSKTSLRWLILFVVVLGLSACAPHEYTGTLLDAPRPIEDFTLTNTDGDSVALSDYAGEWVLVYFGFTNCPDLCPATLFEVKRAWEDLGTWADDIAFVMISVDPQRDTPTLLSQYVNAFNPAFTGLRTDDAAQLDAVLRQFSAYYQIDDPEGEYIVTHTTSLFLLDPEGRMRAVFGYGVTGEQLADDLTALMREG